MKTLTFQYSARRFQQRNAGGEPLLLFVAPVGEIKAWAGVPRKAFDYLNGFQRTLQDSRVIEVAQYFRQSSGNVSPTSIVIGLRSGVTRIEPPAMKAGSRVDDVMLEISLLDFASMDTDSLIVIAVENLQARLDDTVIDAIKANPIEAAATAARLEDESLASASSGDETQGSELDEVVEDGDRSYLEDFYAQLVAIQQGLLPLTDEASLRETLYSIVKPAMIVDGQHRVFGAATADEAILFSVTAIPDASWEESVYQFVVLNQKARPIRPAFLSAIIASSLSEEEVSAVYDRLKASKVDVERSKTMDDVNASADSPFRDMIDFEVEGSPGFLKFPGMSRLVQDFKNIPMTHPILLKDAVWNGEGEWLTHFFSMWWGVRDYFESRDERLWKKPAPENPNHLLMIVALQEMQRLMLDNWADGRVFSFEEPSKTREYAAKFWDGFPPAFFTDPWQQKGLQTSTGRGILRNALTETRRTFGKKNWGYRKLLLFRPQ